MEKHSISLYRLVAITLLVGMMSVSACFGQAKFATGRSDNGRTGANTNETLLTPQNVNKNGFGFLFNYPIDYLALAQPLYVPNVNINVNGQVTQHNVVYVATMADSVYAFDADSGVGLNGNPYLWTVNFTNPAIYGPGITTASGAELPCSGGKTTGFTQEGIAGTPVIDTTAGIMYVVAKTVENGTVLHRLHALDITTGQELLGGPVVINAFSVSKQGQKMNFTSLHELNRPGLLLLNGAVYMAFGSNACNDGNASGWVLSYSASNLSPISVFNDSPDHGSASIWQTGNGISADENNNIFVETAESCPSCYNIQTGGQTYSNSVVELDPNSLTVTDYFTPFDVVFLNSWDEDLSSTGVLILPDQDGLTPHELVAAGKEGFVFVLDRDSLGGYNGSCGNPGPTCDDVLQEFPLIPGEQEETIKSVLFSSPAYWNNTVYFAPDASPLLAYPLSSGPVPLGAPVQTLQKHPGAHSPSISANGNADGILWVISGGNLYAFDAVTMLQLYSSIQVKSRDDLPPVAHFATQTVVNGKVYIATQTTLEAYGLFQNLTLAGGGNQSGPVLSTLPVPLQVQVIDPYNAVGIAGVSVTFSDGGKGGSFNPPNQVSDSNGNVSTNYTFGKTAGIYTITASSTKAANLTFTETATAGPASRIIASKGNQQTGQAGSILPTQLRVTIQDAYNNGVPGVTATFVDQSGAGTLNPSAAVTNASGYAMVSYQLPNIAGKYKVVASALALKTTTFTEHATGDSPTTLAVLSGNNQSAVVNTALSQPLVVRVTDQGGTPVAGVSVTFSASSGTFTGAPATSDANGMATVNYTTGNSTGTVTITAAVNGVTTSITVNVTGAPATVTVSGGNNQFGTAGTTLPQALSVVVQDQYSNPVSGVAVSFSDGGVGGSFSYANPVTTDNTGTAFQYYTLPPTPGTFNIVAYAAGVTNPAAFTETGQ